MLVATKRPLIAAALAISLLHGASATGHEPISERADAGIGDPCPGCYVDVVVSGEPLPTWISLTWNPGWDGSGYCHEVDYLCQEEKPCEPSDVIIRVANQHASEDIVLSFPGGGIQGVGAGKSTTFFTDSLSDIECGTNPGTIVATILWTHPVIGGVSSTLSIVCDECE